MPELTEVNNLSYEEAFAELEAVVKALEAGELPLEKSLDEFQRGQSLAARCSQLLEQAELKLRRMVEEEAAMSMVDDADSEDE